MGSIKVSRGEQKHWFSELLKFKVRRLPEIRRQKKSKPGQLSLPGMDGEAERTMKGDDLDEHYRLVRD